MVKKKIEIPTFVKWAGGKTQLLYQYKEFFPKKIDRYFEPFVGGGAVFFYVKQKFRPEFCMISDINEHLMNTYKSVKEGIDSLIGLLKEIKKTNHSKETFYNRRREFNKIRGGLKKAALLIYLNKTCFNGLYRVNSKGEFNVPFGKYNNPAILQESKLRLASKLLKDVEIKKTDFMKILGFAKKGDFVYFDPPYYPITKTSSFTDYQINSFGEKEQKKLARIFKTLDKRGCKVMLSNSDTEFIRGLYKDYNIHIVRAARMINCNGAGRGKINELVITNFEPSQRRLI